jgi:hypothetical protein
MNKELSPQQKGFRLVCSDQKRENCFLINVVLKGALEATRIRMGLELISRSYKYVKIWMIGSLPSPPPAPHPKKEKEIHKEVRLRSIHCRGNKRDLKILLEEVCILESWSFRSEFGIAFWR